MAVGRAGFNLSIAVAVGMIAVAGLSVELGLVPIMYSTGSGADVMKRIAAPMLGGVGSALLLVLVVFPAIFSLWRGWHLPENSE